MVPVICKNEINIINKARVDVINKLWLFLVSDKAVFVYEHLLIIIAPVPFLSCFCLYLEYLDVCLFPEYLDGFSLEDIPLVVFLSIFTSGLIFHPLALISIRRGETNVITKLWFFLER
jgi:hypothetical protein